MYSIIDFNSHSQGYEKTAKIDLPGNVDGWEHPRLGYQTVRTTSRE